MAEALHDTMSSPAFTEPPTELRAASFGKQYQAYVEDRNLLHELESHRGSAEDQKPNISTQAKVVRMHREAVGEAALYLFEGCPNLPTFTNHVAFAIRETDDPRDNETVIFDNHIMPPSLSEDVPSPIEAVMVTAEMKYIAFEFAKAGEASTTGLIMSGAPGWGAFYAPRGVHPRIEAPTPTNRSDLDLLAIVPEIDDIGETLAHYVDAGLIDKSELERFDTFKKLQKIGLADIFSLRSHYKGLEQSVHFLTHEITHTLTALHGVRQRSHGQHRINFVRDYRPNMPNNPNKNGGGYTIDDLKGLYIGELFGPRPEATERGYLTDSPVGSLLTVEGEKTYSLGLLDFFLAVRPEIIYDSQHKTEAWVNTLQSTIAHIQGAEKPKNIPRMLRMPKSTLRHIEHSLSLARDE
jgi:hypothetical protein